MKKITIVTLFFALFAAVGFSQPETDAQPCAATPTVKDIDGNVYNTVQIGTQCWMKENLKTTKYADGTLISLGKQHSGEREGAMFRYYPGNKESNVSIYGYLYNWYAVVRNNPDKAHLTSPLQGVCPTGWHVPIQAEYDTLAAYLSNYPKYVCNSPDAFKVTGMTSYDITKALASTKLWQAHEEKCTPGYQLSTNNSSGFSALPAGGYEYWEEVPYSDGGIGINCSFWCRDEDPDSGTGYVFGFNNMNQDMWLGTSNEKANGCSVRCLKD